MGDVYTLFWLSSGELSKAFDLRNLCYSKISVVQNARISRKLESEREKNDLHPNAAYLNS